MSEQSIVLAFHQTSRRFFPGINNIRPDHLFSILELLDGWGFMLTGGTDQSTEEKKKHIILTFDDGYKDNYEVFLRLSEMEITPTVFIPTAYIGQDNSWDYSSRLFPARHLDAQDIRRLSDAGVSIGSHGLTHRALTSMPEKQLRQELSVSRQQLEDITGREINIISFPFGRVNAKVIAACHDCGYEQGFTMDGSVVLEKDNFFLVARVAIYRNDDYLSLQGKIRHRSRWARIRNRIINDLASGTIITSS